VKEIEGELKFEQTIEKVKVNHIIFINKLVETKFPFPDKR